MKVKELYNKFKNANKLEFIRKNNRVIAISMISFSGMLCLGMGIMLPFVPVTKNNDIVFLQIKSEQIEKKKSNEIVLKEMESEVNQPLSVDVKDYVDTTKLDSKVIKKLKLDTSAVNISEPGNYTYTIKYKNKTYNGIYIIKEKPLPQVDKMTLKNLKFTIGDILPKNAEAYIEEQLSDEVKANLQIDLSKVNMNAAGNYPYSVSYNGRFYTGLITVEEKPAPAAETPPADTTQEGTQN